MLVDVIEDEETSDYSGWSEEAPILDREEKTERVTKKSIALEEEIDQQKKFYGSLASKVKHDDSQEDAHPRSPKRRVGLYRRLLIKFILLLGVIFLVIAYFSFSKLTITLHLKGESLSSNLLLKVASSTPDVSSAASLTSTDPREDISGSVKVMSVTATETYPATGETSIGDEVSGRVRIINNYNKNQALVATTRLLSSDGKLFRIKEAVTIPAGGETVVDIYADKPTADMAISPSSFTIPGLWAGLQDKIYARSDEAFVFSKKVQKHVNSSDLEAAARDINTRLLEKAKSQAEGDDGQDWLYQLEGSPSVELGAKLGDKKDSFTATATGKVIAVYFDKEQAGALAQAKLNLAIPDDKELTEFNPERIAYSFESYDEATGSATIKAVFNATMILKQGASFVDSRQLVNLTGDQIASYLRDRPEVKEFELKFSPSMIKRAPSLADRIEITINKD